MSNDYLNVGNDAPATTRATPVRTLNTTFAINAPARRPVFASYSVRVACAAGERGHVELRSDVAAPPTTVVSQAGAAAGAASSSGDRIALPRTWFLENVGANLTGFVMAAGGGITGGTVWRAPLAGTLTAMSAQASEPMAAGQLFILATVNGIVQSGVSFNPGDQGQQATFSSAYVAGDLIGCKITTNAGFLPLTLDVEAWLEAQQEGGGGGQSVTSDVVVSGWVYPGNNVRIATVSDVGAPVFTFLSSMEVQF